MIISFLKFTGKVLVAYIIIHALLDVLGTSGAIITSPLKKLGIVKSP